MENQRLLTALAEAKLLDKPTLEKLEKDALTLNREAELLIYQRNLVSEEEVAKIKSRILGVPYKKVEVSQIDAELLKIIPKEAAFTYKIIPIAKKDNLLVVGMVHPDNVSAQNVLKFIAKQKGISLGVYLITPSDADAVLRRYSTFKDEIQAALEALRGKPMPTAKLVQLEETRVTAGEEAPIIKIVASILREAVNVKASDIHIEPQRNQLRVRFRIDGLLQTVQTLPVEIHQQVVSRVKVLANLRLDETRIPQDGRFRTAIFDRDIDFRISTFPTPFGEKAAIRVLDPLVGLKGLDDLGLMGSNLELFQSGLTKPYGMILMSGPTGSGKSTTLYAAMQLLNRESSNIVSLEDPVEYSIDGLNQSQVKPEIGYDFASGLRQILRQDPDVIMVGEIRDSETASLTVHASLTGHIVLSTIHTNNATGIIPRLVDLGVQTFLLPSSLNLMAAQRLVGRLCQDCKKAEEAPAPIAAIIKEAMASLPDQERARHKDVLQEPYKIYTASGCETCRGKGVIGRIAIFEVFQMTRELGEIVIRGISENKIIDEARRQGMVTLRQDGLLKALHGLVSAIEVIRETEEV